MILDHFYEARNTGKKKLAVLIDPDKPDKGKLLELIREIGMGGADMVFLGGSLLVRNNVEEFITIIKENSEVPVILFPGSISQVSDKADALLFLSLISGRNPELLIGNHVMAAPLIRRTGLETLPTGYMLVDCGKPTTARYMSNSNPIPHDKPEIAACTAMAGEMLGLKLMYLDGGSGAEQTVDPEMIRQVRQSVNTPIIVGGGIRNAAKAQALCEAGADVIVIGNVTEENPQIITEIAKSIHSLPRYEHLH